MATWTYLEGVLIIYPNSNIIDQYRTNTEIISSFLDLNCIFIDKEMLSRKVRGHTSKSAEFGGVVILEGRA